MNTPIDPREGDRRQKALRARLAAMAQKNKAMIGRMGQHRGRVRSMGAIGGARGARFPRNGAARPGALNFLQPRGEFGLRAHGPVGGPEMNPVFGAGGPRHVANPLPSRGLEMPQQPGDTSPFGPNFQPADTPGDPGYSAPNPGNPTPGAIITDPSGRGAVFTSTGSAADNLGWDNPLVGGLVPLGGGVYLNPVTGEIHGTGPGSPLGGGGGGGSNLIKAR